MPDNKKTYTIAGIVAAIIIVAAVAIFSAHKPQTAEQQTPATTQSSEDYSLTPATDTSNTALDKDLNSVDSQLNNLDDDMSSIGQSLEAGNGQ